MKKDLCKIQEPLTSQPWIILGTSTPAHPLLTFLCPSSFPIFGGFTYATELATSFAFEQFKLPNSDCYKPIYLKRSNSLRCECFIVPLLRTRNCLQDFFYHFRKNDESLCYTADYSKIIISTAISRCRLLEDSKACSLARE